MAPATGILTPRLFDNGNVIMYDFIMMVTVIYCIRFKSEFDVKSKGCTSWKMIYRLAPRSEALLLCSEEFHSR